MPPPSGPRKHTCGWFLQWFPVTNCLFGKAREQGITAVYTTGDKNMHQHLHASLREKSATAINVFLLTFFLLILLMLCATHKWTPAYQCFTFPFWTGLSLMVCSVSSWPKISSTWSCLTVRQFARVCNPRFARNSICHSYHIYGSSIPLMCCSSFPERGGACGGWMCLGSLPRCEWKRRRAHSLGSTAAGGVGAVLCTADSAAGESAAPFSASFGFSRLQSQFHIFCQHLSPGL